ncbi:hypothetical protein [Rothia uropygialis]|uniref:hypothetical protein n=1 Tax=Kocuria sp. 36 TaxID=1415402 RepID=UPI00101E03DF|nr:hypothetical protein [Kocuria sp. 36]
MIRKTDVTKRPRWGYVRHGSRKVYAWKPALALGAITTAAASLPASLLTTHGTFDVLAFFIFCTFLLSPLYMLWWLILVDRETVRGAIKAPEKSIESTWYTQAAQGVFHDLLIVMGLGAALTSWWKLSFDISWFFLGGTVAMMVDFAARYAYEKSRS